MDFIKTLNKYNMISPNDKILVAVSGGADSVALLYAFFELKESYSLSLFVCHINHNLRGTDSQEDAGFVNTLCSDLGLPLFSYSANVRSEAEGLSLEEAGRRVRYRYFCEAAQEVGATKIATGHNQNDNAETLVLRLCRGTGLRGLGGIPPTRKIKGKTEEKINDLILIRPLIETDRTAIETYLKDRGVIYRTDASNFDKTFFRNRIRHDIIPLLAQLNPKVVNLLAKSAELLREDEEFIENMCTEILESCLFQKDGDICLKISDLQKASASARKRIIRAALVKINSERIDSERLDPKRLDSEKVNSENGSANNLTNGPANGLINRLNHISQSHISQIESLLTSQTGKETQLPGGIIVWREYECLIFSTNIQDHTFCFDIPLDTEVYIPAIGGYIRAHVQEVIENSSTINNSIKNRPAGNSSDMCTKYFNYDRIRGLLQIRSRRPGDRIALTGYNKKLKKELCDRKIPKNQRDKLPLLALGNDILWIMDSSSRTSANYLPKPGCTVLAVSVLQ